MPKQSLSYQAETLWLRLRDAKAEAEAEQDWNRALRIEDISERAWWRLLRRLTIARVHRRSMIRRSARARCRARLT